jgi:hypothetical protein
VTKTQRASVLQRLNDTVSNEVCRHWGAPALGVPPGGTPRFYIIDIRGLFMAADLRTLAQFRPGTTVDSEKTGRYRCRCCEATRGTRRVVAYCALALTRRSLTLLRQRGTRRCFSTTAYTRWLDVMDNVRWLPGSLATARKVEPTKLASRTTALGHHSHGVRRRAVGMPPPSTAANRRNGYARTCNKHGQFDLRPDISLAIYTSCKRSRSLCPDVAAAMVAYETLTPEVVFLRENEDRGVYYWRAGAGTACPCGSLSSAVEEVLTKAGTACL